MSTNHLQLPDPKLNSNFHSFLPVSTTGFCLIYIVNHSVILILHGVFSPDKLMTDMWV